MKILEEIGDMYMELCQQAPTAVSPDQKKLISAKIGGIARIDCFINKEIYSGKLRKYRRAFLYYLVYSSNVKVTAAYLDISEDDLQQKLDELEGILLRVIGYSTIVNISNASTVNEVNLAMERLNSLGY